MENDIDIGLNQATKKTPVTTPTFGKLRRSFIRHVWKKQLKTFWAPMIFPPLELLAVRLVPPLSIFPILRIGGPFPYHLKSIVGFSNFEGDAFLRKMIRIMVGTLVEIGTYWRAIDDVPGFLMHVIDALPA